MNLLFAIAYWLLPTASVYSVNYGTITNFLSVSRTLVLIYKFLARVRNRFPLSLYSAFHVSFCCICVSSWLIVKNWYSHNRYHNKTKTNLNMFLREPIRFLVLLLHIFFICDHFEKLFNRLLCRHFIFHLLWC